MTLILIAAGVILAPFAYLLAILALRRLRGRQLAKWMAEHEGREFVDTDCPRVNHRRLVAVKWKDQ